jgi:tellurite methyltransferase
MDVTLADISGVALAKAREQAGLERLSLRTLAIDLEQDDVPAGPWDLVVVVRFLWRPLFGAISPTIAPGGRLVVVHPTRSNLQRHERPGPRFLLDDGELPGLVRGLEVESYEEGWTAEGLHEARLVARRGGPAAAVPAAVRSP